MPYLVLARDGAGRLMLARETREAAEKKAAELEEMGCFDVNVIEKADREGVQSLFNHDEPSRDHRIVSRYQQIRRQPRAHAQRVS